MNQKIILLFLFLVVTVVAKAQILVLKDAQTGVPVEWVTVLSQNPKVYQSSNAKGEVDLSTFQASKEIIFARLGYQTQKLSFQELQQLGFTLLLTPDQLNLDEVVVSATRWHQTSTQCLGKVSSISLKQVENLNPQTTADLLGTSGKVFIQKSQQGGGSPMIRGFATNRLLYSVDGVRMNTAIFRAGNIQNVISLDPFAIEQTEVLFGSSSVMYGSDAIGGVMSFQTLTPQLSLSDKALVSGKASTRYSSANNEFTGHFDVNLGWKKWAITSSVSSFNFDHLRQGSHGPDDYLKAYYVQRFDSADHVIQQNDPLLQVPTAYSQINMMQKIRFKPNTNWDFQYGFHYSKTSSYGRYDRHVRMKNDLPRYAEWDYGPQLWNMHHFQMEYQSKRLLFDQMTLRLAKQYFEESRIDRDFNKLIRHTKLEKVDAYSLNLDLIKSLGNRNSISYGAEYVINNVNSTGVDYGISTALEVEAASRYPDSRWQSVALFLNDQHQLNEKWLLQAGLRYNQYLMNSDYDTTFYPFPFTESNYNKGALTGSFGAVFRPNNKLVINANLSTAFRAPNVDDMGKVFDSQAGNVVVPNPYLEAEYAYNADLGFTKILGQWLKLDMAFYYTYLKNAMVVRDYQLNGLDSMVYEGSMSKIQAVQNAAFAKVYGIQLGVDIKLGVGFSVTSDYNFQKGIEELDNATTSPLRHAAPAFGVTRFIYSKEGLMLQLYANYQAEVSYENLAEEERGKVEIYAKDALGNPYAPSWYTLNFKAAYQINSMFTVSAGIENLTDQRYRPYSSGMSAAGRNYVMALNMHF